VSRFANPTRTERFTFPDGCGCPGTPHEQDWMALRTELGAEETAQLSMLPVLGATAGPRALAVLLTEWNLLDDDGQPAAPTPENVGRMWADLYSDELNAWIDQHVRMTSLPNGSGGRSPNGSSATASRGRRKPGPRSSTTSS
jgi:hypothetical protein